MKTLEASRGSSWADFSPCKTYRYTLGRRWDAPGSTFVTFIGLNPSTATATEDDPTIRRCIRFAKDWGHGGMIMLNLFALRSTDPKRLREVRDPVGPENDFWIRMHLSETLVVACWGSHGAIGGRGYDVEKLVRERFEQRSRPRQMYGMVGSKDEYNTQVPVSQKLYVFGFTKRGKHPRHPLYLRGDSEPIEWPNR